jgi:hypothetical protein
MRELAGGSNNQDRRIAMASTAGKQSRGKSNPRSGAVKASKPATIAKDNKRAITKPARASRAPTRSASAADSAPEQDRLAILAVSKKWWDANRKFSIPMMREAFVGGDKFHGFNLNGHTYYAIDEWVQLWNYLAGVMQPVADPAEGTMAEPRDVRLVIRGDMAFLTAESTFTVKVRSTAPGDSSLLPPAGQVARIPFRATEVFVREDHAGNPVWKMWHFHCSPKAPEGERRMGF